MVLAALLASGALIPGEPSLTGYHGMARPTHDVPGAFDAAAAAFQARLDAAHPPGSPTEALRAALRAEGFEMEVAGEAHLLRDGFMCELGWTVIWTGEGGVLRSVVGDHYGNCL